MAQTTITENPDVAIAGEFATAEEGNNQVISREAGATIPVGVIVVQDGADDALCALPSGAASITGGTVLGMAMRPPSGATTYAAGDTVRIAAAGVVWMNVQTGATAGAPVYVQHTGANFGEVDDTNTANHDALPDAVFRNSRTSAGLAKVKLGGTFI